MPRMNKQLVASMKTKGYIPLAQAAELCHLSPMGVKMWLTHDPPKVEGTQVGSCWFVSYASLLKHLGPEAAKLLDLPKGKAPKTAPADQ